MDESGETTSIQIWMREKRNNNKIRGNSAIANSVPTPAWHWGNIDGFLRDWDFMLYHVLWILQLGFDEACSMFLLLCSQSPEEHTNRYWTGPCVTVEFPRQPLKYSSTQKPTVWFAPTLFCGITPWIYLDFRDPDTVCNKSFTQRVCCRVVPPAC